MFEGFQAETIDFLWGIRLNNRRDWFEAHKAQYLQCLYEPMKALAEAVWAAMPELPGARLHVSRIYRDARYARGLPYKDSLWFSVRGDADYWAQHPCLYFDLHPEYFGYGLAVVYPQAETMERFRAWMADRPDDFLALLDRTARATGLTLSGETYRRKKPCPDGRLASYFQLKQLLCCREEPVGDALFSPALAQEVAETWKGLLPLYAALQNLTN